MPERRTTPRGRTLKSGKVVLNDGRSVIDCAVRNLSVTGACLEVASTIGIPEAFGLTIEGEGALRTCTLKWTSARRIGVAFEAGDPVAIENAGPTGARSSTMVFSKTPVVEANSRPDLVRNELIQLRAALDEVPFGVVLLDGEMRAQFINRAFRKMWKLPDAKADSKPAFVALMYHGRDTRAYEVPARDVNAYIAERVASVKQGNPHVMDLRLSNGEVLRFQCAVLPAGGRMLSYTVVTDIVRKSDELEYLRAALDNIKDGIVVLDADLNVRHVNGVVKELWRLGDADLRGLNYGDLIRMGRKRGFLPEPPEGSEARIARNLALIRADDPTPNEFQLAGRTVRTRRAALADGGHILTFGDISDFVQRASQLQTMANTDDLTGTPNRRGFMAAAKKEWGRFQRYHRPMSLLSIDIDHFKSINDSFGHDVGDAALVHIANLSKRNRRDSDVVARMGGEEFAILLPETTIEQAINVGERLRAEIAATPCEARGQRVAMTVSLGAAQATLGMAGIHVLMKLADQAMYRAKSGGRNRIEAASSSPDADRLAAE